MEKIQLTLDDLAAFDVVTLQLQAEIKEMSEILDSLNQRIDYYFLQRDKIRDNTR